MAQKLGELIDKISIHALREEGDRPAGHPAESPAEFLSTPSARRATTCAVCSSKALSHFYPRPPRGGRRLPHTCSTLGVRISIHALREEGDHVADTICSEWLEYFYPRPPRGGRLKGQKKVVGRYLFLSTPSARRATQKGCTGWDSQVISIHALREEGDPPQRRGITARRNFYPRPPRGGRPRLSGVPLRTLEISIHALREEGDTSKRLRPCLSGHFYPRPPRGGRP